MSELQHTKSALRFVGALKEAGLSDAEMGRIISDPVAAENAVEGIRKIVQFDDKDDVIKVTELFSTVRNVAAPGTFPMIGIRTVGQLAQLHIKQFEEIHGIGPTLSGNTSSALQRMGYSFSSRKLTIERLRLLYPDVRSIPTGLALLVAGVSFYLSTGVIRNEPPNIATLGDLATVTNDEIALHRDGLGQLIGHWRRDPSRTFDRVLGHFELSRV